MACSSQVVYISSLQSCLCQADRNDIWQHKNTDLYCVVPPRIRYTLLSDAENQKTTHVTHRIAYVFVILSFVKASTRFHSST